MKKLAINKSLILVLVVIMVKPVFSQESTEKRSCGLSASFQSTQLDIMVPFWAGRQTIIAPAFSLNSVEDTYTDYGVALVFRFYSRMRRVTPYWGGRIGALVLSPKDHDSVTDYILGLLYGGEFFFTANFSIGVEAQMNVLMSDDNSSRFGNPGGTNLNTGAAVIANVYF